MNSTDFPKKPGSVDEDHFEWFREREGWRRESCCMCNGTGMTSDYGCGDDFYGPKECTSCNGTGMYWITPRGRYVEFPGGRFV